MRSVDAVRLIHAQKARPSFVGRWALGVALSSAALTGACASDDDGGSNPASGGSSNAGSGGAMTGSGGSGTSGQLPADKSQASIEAFIQAGTYKSWTHDAAVRPASSPQSVYHGNALQVYFNDVAVSAAGGDVPAGGMAVKEIYDETTSALMATAVSLHPSDGSHWVYYCTGGDLCAGGTTGPTYDASGDSQCSNCHADAFYAPLP